MAKIEVIIIRNGQAIKKIIRPLHFLDGKPAVRYFSRLVPLVNENEIHIGAANQTDGERDEKAVKKEDDEPEHKPVISPLPFIEWDKCQNEIICAAPEARLLVSAGPGTGKTAVACARVAHLINSKGLEPGCIWLISFTRTAVREIRDRIAGYLNYPEAAYLVKIATLDSHAWAIHSGFDDAASILGSYEDNIEQVINLIRESESVLDYLETVMHLIVDEAQDIVGIRADLVTTIVEHLLDDCGVTVFADEAQSIYGFSADESVCAEGERQLPLPEEIRKFQTNRFKECDLVHVYRTGSPELLKIFTDTRKKVLAPSDGENSNLDAVREDVAKWAHGSLATATKNRNDFADQNDLFILYRRRCDVLLESSFWENIPHRIRMSKLPASIAPWVGVTLADYVKPAIDKDTFMALWSARVDSTTLASIDADTAWGFLIRIAGKTRTIVDMRLLRQRLGRKQPPAELCQAEVGNSGPIIGTIHASKGRETDIVHLMLPVYNGVVNNQDEEARVVFVGATRGRVKLLIGRGYNQYARSVERSGRVYSLKTRNGKPRAQVEIGLENDLIAEGVTGRHFFCSPEEALAGQNRIRNFAGVTVPVLAESDPEAEFAYRIKEKEENPCLAVLSAVVNDDLFEIGRAIQSKICGRKRRPPDSIMHLYVRGIRSIVLPPDAPECEVLHEPWANTGIMLAPLVTGFSTLYFPYY